MKSISSDIPYWWPYLHYGYLPPNDGKLPFDIPKERMELPQYLKDAAVVAGVRLSEVIHEYIEPGKTHLIPLSGGLDSRALLAAAMEAGADILTVTFGSPGTLDYEYGKQVALEAGVRHECISLPAIQLTTQRLIDTVQAGGSWTYLFDACYNRILTEEYAEGCVILHGFAGDPVAGSHLPKKIYNNGEVKERFAQKQKYSKKRNQFLSSCFDPVDVLPDPRKLPSILGLTQYEVMDLSVRQRGAIKPIVIDKRYDVRTPFTDPRWLECILSIPTKWRRNCWLYEAALISRWPDLFSMPAKNGSLKGTKYSRYEYNIARLANTGIRKAERLLTPESFKSKMINYIDFDKAFDAGGIHYELMKENLEDLFARDIWRHFYSGGLDTAIMSDSKTLQMMIGLEINIKAEEQVGK